ncbi:ComF family protein [Fusibacter sp. A1]|nr:ComF family protein [Fusibacter sp. A1]
MLCEKEEKLDAPYLCKTCLSKLEEMPFSHNREIPVYKQVISGYLLNETAKKIIYKHKYGHKRYMSHVLAHLLAEKIVEEGLEFEVITSIPSGKKRNRMRGCDHAYDIAVELGHIVKKPVRRMLKRVHHESTQSELSKLERYGNMADAFKLINGTITETEILVIDDIYTTGATMEAAARLLSSEDRKLIGATVFYTPIQK